MRIMQITRRAVLTTLENHAGRSGCNTGLQEPHDNHALPLF